MGKIEKIKERQDRDKDRDRKRTGRQIALDFRAYLQQSLKDEIQTQLWFLSQSLCLRHTMYLRERRSAILTPQSSRTITQPSLLYRLVIYFKTGLVVLCLVIIHMEISGIFD